ncbi:MAG: SPOR domain-containing protein [Pseudomonadota bacterium]
MRYTILIGLLAAIALPARAEIPLDAAEVIQPVQLIRGNHTTALQARQTLAESDIIKTGGNRAAVTLHFARDGILTLGSSSQLLIHGASPANLGRGEVLRAQLVRGELTLEAYPASNTVPKDYRLNIGPLQVRALGADLWAYVSSVGEAVCLHQGALEITGSAGEQRLDFAGDCLLHRAGGPLQFMPGGEPELKDRLLTAEQSTVDIAEAELRPVNVTTPVKVQLTPTPAAAPAPAPAPAPHKAVNTSPQWVVVLATARSRAAADDIAFKLGKRTLRTTVRETGKPQAPFSVTFGSFATQKEATQFSKKLQRKYHLKVIRVAALSQFR